MPLKKFESPCKGLKGPPKKKKEKENQAVQIATDMSVAICTAWFSFSFFFLGGPLSPLHGDSNFLSGTRSHSMPRQYGCSRISLMPPGPQPGLLTAEQQDSAVITACSAG